MNFAATHCPRCLGRFMHNGEEWFCINCSYRPRIIPLGNWYAEHEVLPKWDRSDSMKMSKLQSAKPLY